MSPTDFFGAETFGGSGVALGSGLSSAGLKKEKGNDTSAFSSFSRVAFTGAGGVGFVGATGFSGTGAKFVVGLAEIQNTSESYIANDSGALTFLRTSKN